jgi:hypothetical protein
MRVLELFAFGSKIRVTVTRYSVHVELKGADEKLLATRVR